jgi:ankyrin repeat protein
MNESVNLLNNLVTKGNLNVNTVISKDYRFKGLSLLEIAVLKEKIEIVKYLLEKGADPNKKLSTTGNTLLYHSMVTNDIELVKILLDGGANPNIKNKDGKYAPLHEAVVYNKIELVKTLLSSPLIDVNIKITGTNDTPLSVVLPTQNIKMIDLLLSAGANEPKIYKLSSEQVDLLMGEIERAYPPESNLYTDTINIPYFRKYVTNYMTQQPVIRKYSKTYYIDDEHPDDLYNYLKDKIEGYFEGYGFP